MPRGIPSIPAAPQARPGRLPSAHSAQAGGLQGGRWRRAGSTPAPLRAPAEAAAPAWSVKQAVELCGARVAMQSARGRHGTHLPGAVGLWGQHSSLGGTWRGSLVRNPERLPQSRGRS